MSKGLRYQFVVKRTKADSSMHCIHYWDQELGQWIWYLQSATGYELHDDAVQVIEEMAESGYVYTVEKVYLVSIEVISSIPVENISFTSQLDIDTVKTEM